MFSKQTYINRRNELKKLVGDGVILLFGNNESPCNYPNNAFYPFRQDSSFLYYFGQQRDGLVGVIDVDNNVETLVGDDIDIEDIVWYGSGKPKKALASFSPTLKRDETRHSMGSSTALPPRQT